METNITINNNEGIVKAFEEEKQVGQIDFTITDSLLSIEHTRTFEGSEGKGVAGALVAAATDYAIENNLKIKPVCSYAQVWYKRHPQYNDILALSVDDLTGGSCSIAKK